MKTPTFLLLLALTACPTLLPAQTQPATIAAIRSEFRRINADTALRTVKLENEDFIGGTDNGSVLTGYYDKSGALRKMVSWVGISMGIYIDEYYFRNGALVFVFSTFKRYATDDSGNIHYERPTVTDFEGRYYFSAGQLIDQHVTGNPMSRSDLSEGAPAQQLLRWSEEYRRKLKKFR